MKNLTKATFLALGFLTVLTLPSTSFADWDRHHRGHGGYHHSGFYASYRDNHHPFIGFNFSVGPYRTYYKGTYVAAPAPVIYQPVYVDQTPPVVVQYQQSSTGGYLAVNVPNKRGGYTTVQLKRISNGFLGPQGEYYSEFPTIGQLQAIYG